MDARSHSEHVAELGFTLLEMVVAVGITAILLLAGGIWLLGMHPGALRNAADDFDAELAAARAIAAGGGNGATIAFTPQTGASGFMMRVYSGRPNAPNAVTTTTVMPLVSSATISEATFGKPPFAIFLSSAGYPTGTAQYPAMTGNGTASFPVIAQQPPCPANNIVLTFSNAQGATATRTLQCNATVAGGASSANPSPTPNALKLNPTFMLAHWTTDAGPLHFIAAEFGYTHWYASAIGNTCNVQSSDTGAAPAAFANGWPYAQPNSPSELTLAPPPPPDPYSWPYGDPNDPPAPFQLSPTVHDGGLCTVRITDDYGQEANAAVQVMGDLTPSVPSLTFSSPTAAAQTVTFGKTFDSESLKLQASSACAGVVIVSIPAPPAPQSTPSTTPTTATMNIAPVAAGSCTLIVGDQYGEPTLSIPINVQLLPPYASWPASAMLMVNEGVVGTASGSVVALRGQALDVALGPVLNALLGGDVARAGSSGPCYELAQLGASYDNTLPSWVSSQLNIGVDPTSNCETDASGNPLGVNNAGLAVYTPSQQSETYNEINTCGPNATFTWLTSHSAVKAAFLGAQGGASATTCTVTFGEVGQSTQTPAPDGGLVAVSVTGPCGSTLTTGQMCLAQNSSTLSECDSENGQGTDSIESLDATVTPAGAATAVAGYSTSVDGLGNTIVTFGVTITSETDQPFSVSVGGEERDFVLVSGKAGDGTDCIPHQIPLSVGTWSFN